MAKYYCGPQGWPAWIRKPLSRYYNRACHNHDANYDDPAIEFDKAEAQFKEEVTRRRGVLKKAYKRGKISYLTYIVHGRLFGLIMPRLTKRYGRIFRN